MGPYEENICERKYAGMKRDSWFDNNSPSLPNLIMMFLRGIRQAGHTKTKFQPGKVKNSTYKISTLEHQV